MYYVDSQNTWYTTIHSLDGFCFKELLSFHNMQLQCAWLPGVPSFVECEVDTVL